MKKIYLGGSGGAPTNNVIRSLRESGNEYLIGASCIPTDLFLADVDERHYVPPAKAVEYPQRFLSLLASVKPDMAHFQNDNEIKVVSSIRDEIKELGVMLYMPDDKVIRDCIDKERSYTLWSAAGIRVPRTKLLETTNDLRNAFDTLGPRIWIRAIEGAAGKGALPTDNYEFAYSWIDNFKGWGTFTASECLTADTVTWLSIWYRGDLVVAQTRKRRSWNFSDRTLSGVTGITGVGETWSDDTTTRVATDSILAIDSCPHGIYGVDMTFDSSGFPNPTEINISRFFTTVYFFTKAGLNMPRIFTDIALYEKFPVLDRKINPLPDGLLWIRGMDTEPALVQPDDYKKFITSQGL